jgi:predicted Rdx family selenoprotein
VADRIKAELGVSEVALVSGDRGEFTVWVGDAVVAKKGPGGFPSEDDVIKRVRDAWGP